MSRLINPWIQYLDEDGNPYSTGTVYFGLPNQDPVANPKVPYSDAALTVSIAASQVLDDKGMFQTAIYMSGGYSMSLFDVLGNPIRTESEIYGAPSTDDGFAITKATIAEAKADDDLVIGSYVTIIDNDHGQPINADYLVAAGVGSGVEGDYWNSDTASLFNLQLRSSDKTLFMYNAAGDGAVDDTIAITNYIASNGQLKVQAGDFKLTTLVIDVPITFELGGSLSVVTANVVTIRRSIDSPKQYILRGAGTYLLEHNGTAGEEAREVHVSWFDVFPGDSAVDSGLKLTALNDSIGNVREVLVHFDVGTYYHATGVVWNRAAKVLGAGDRLTNIWVQFLGGDVWSTGGSGANFHGFQFNSDAIRTSGAYIHLLHDRCETYDIYMDKGYEGIVLDASECESHRTKGLTWSTVAGSSLIRVAHDDGLVKTVNYTSSTPVGPEYVLWIGSDDRTVNRTRAYDIYSRTSQAIVGIVSDAFAVNEIKVSDVTAREGTDAVTIIAKGAASPNVIQINTVTAGVDMTNGVRVVTAATASIFGVTLDNISANEVSGNGIEITNDSTGNIRPVTIGQHELRGAIGLKIGGTGNPPSNITIGNGGARNCVTRGYDITSDNFTMSSGIVCASNPNDVTLNLGCTNFIVQGNYFPGGLVDNSGAVTKIVADNL